MKHFVLGDVHGRFGALKEVFRKSKFDYKKDMLIIIGDIVEGGGQTKECVNELLKVKNKIFILGNHDKWFIDWFEKEEVLDIWYYQGGKATIKSYSKDPKKVPQEHKEFFKSAKPFYIKDNILFVHGGLDPFRMVAKQDIHKLIWDRSIIPFAQQRHIPIYEHVFIGHTTTEQFDELKPLTFHNLTMIDTGAGWSGKLTLMDVKTRKYWQSRKQRPVR